MINDYSTQLEVFSYLESQEETRVFMEKYWLDSREYLEKWKFLQNRIFINNKHFPDMVFNSEFEIIILGGGLIFNQEDFELLKNCIKHTGDEEFVIIQNYNKNDPPKIYTNDSGWVIHPPLRFKFPVNITWNELLEGGGVSDELFKSPYKEYFVFGNNGGWGKYVANDFNYPLDIIGFIKGHAPIFESIFKVSKEEREEIKKAIPLIYEKYL